MGEEEEGVSEEIALAKINTAGLQNFRRDDLWKDANNHSRNGLYKKWNEDLDALWRELSGSVKKDSPEETEFFNIDKEFAEAFSSVKNSIFEDINKDEIQNLIKQKRILIKKEIFLRRLEDAQGKGAAYRESADDYMMG